MIVSMRSSGLAHNSISSYCRVLRTFLNWFKRSGLNVPELPNTKGKETVKEAYLQILIDSLVDPVSIPRNTIIHTADTVCHISLSVQAIPDGVGCQLLDFACDFTGIFFCDIFGGLNTINRNS